jgi:hypothetical protein
MENCENVPFTENAVRDYLDGAIRGWRKKRDEKGEGSEVAVFYIDAFQSVRTSIFGETLPKDIVPAEPEDGRQD